MLVWGGFNGSYLASCGRYNPVFDSWSATILDNAPDALHLHTSVWNGSAMIVWGGIGQAGYLKSGGALTPPQPLRVYLPLVLMP